MCKNPCRISDDFPNTIGLHQEFVLLSSYLFTLINKLTKYIYKSMPKYMLFTDDIVLIDETKEGINIKLEVWREALYSKGFKIIRNKIEYMKYFFSNIIQQM